MDKPINGTLVIKKPANQFCCHGKRQWSGEYEWSAKYEPQGKFRGWRFKTPPCCWGKRRTHRELVVSAAVWLRNTLHCRVVLTEPRAISNAIEQPDEIGWVRGYCVVVECKTSRQDFLADKKKICRDMGNGNYGGLGHWRFYLSLPSLIEPNELPAGWGLYVVKGHRIHHAGGMRYAKAAQPPFESNRDAEVGILLQAVVKAEWEKEE